MHSSKTLERRAFLASTAATVVTAAAGCEDDTKNGGTPDAGTSGEGDDTTTNSQTSANAADGDASLVDAGQSNLDGSAQTENLSSGQYSSHAPSSDGGASGGTSSADASSSGSTGQNSSSTSSSAQGSSGTSTSSTGSVTGETSSSSTTETDTSSDRDTTTSEIERPSEDACFEGGGTDAGLGQDAGGGLLCSTNTDNGNHCHPLSIPQSDIDSLIEDRTYVLEDGGTGHTHTITISGYDIYYLQAGIAHEFTSTTDAGHEHICLITCSG